jgi:molybdate transport system regulatory protein
MVTSALTASLVLRRGGGGQVGAERIALLAALRDHGSISAAAKAVGLSYKGAWDVVQALNNLFERPLVHTQTGGRTGGAAGLTPEGEAVIAAFNAVEAELAQLFDTVERRLLDPSGPPLRSLLWSLNMKTSARNALRGVVESVTDGAVNAEVCLGVGVDTRIVAVVTRPSVEALELAPGRDAIALIKSSFVILAPETPGLRTSARNHLAGTVIAVSPGAVNSEVTLELDAGKTLTATITRESAEGLDFAVGDRAVALIKASHVILAVE